MLNQCMYSGNGCTGLKKLFVVLHYLAGFTYLLLQDIDLPFLDVQHVLHVSDLSCQCALFIRQVLQLLGLLRQELLLLLQTHPQSVDLE